MLCLHALFMVVGDVWRIGGGEEGSERTLE